MVIGAYARAAGCPARRPSGSPPLELGTQLAVFGPAALALYSTDHILLASDYALVANGVLVSL